MLLAWLEWLDTMANAMPWMFSWWFIVLMIVLLAGLIGAYFVVRNKRPEEDD